MKKRNLFNASPGFTIVELIVVVVISTLMVGVIISFMIGATDQFTINAVRSKLNVQATNANNVIGNDVQYAQSIISENTVTDASAPSDDNTWNSGPHQLVLGTTARDSDGAPLGGDSYDNIVYYLNGDTLYRRIVADTSPDNRYTTKTCAQTASGGCSTDMVIARDVDSFDVTYYTSGNIETTDLDEDVATSVSVSLVLKTVQSHHTVSVKSGSRYRILLSPTSGSTATASPDSYIPTLPPLTVGYGTLSLSSSSAIIQGDALIYGNIDVAGNSTLKASNLSVAHNNCGTGASYGTQCPASPAPAIATMSTIQADTLCGPALPVATAGFSGTIIGTQTTDCTLPTSLPKINKKALIDTIPVANTAPGQTCPWGSSITMQANYRYTGNVTTDTCTINVQGSGVLYIEGNLKFGNNSKLKVAAGITDPVTIVVNGKVTTGMTTIGDSTSTVNLISFYSSNSSCSNAPDCNSLSPSDLYDSRNLAAITIGSNTTNYANIYAPFAMVKVDLGTQKSHVLYGQTVKINQTYNVTLTSP